MSRRFRQTKRELKKSNSSGKRTFLAKLFVSLTSCAILVAISIFTAVANNVPFTVIDFEKNYKFTSQSSNIDDIIDQAISLGMSDIGANDKVVQENNVVHIKRGIPVNFVIDAVSREQIAYEGDTIRDTLINLEIPFDEKTKIEPSPDSIIYADEEIVVTNPINVTIDFNGTIYETETYDLIVSDILLAEAIPFNENDVVEPSANTILKNNSVIKIKTNSNITFKDGTGKAVSYKTNAPTVSTFIKEQNISLGEFDYCNYPFDEFLQDDMAIELIRVEIKEKTVNEKIQYQEKYIEDSSMYEGQKRTKSSGKNGSKTVTYADRYENGKLVSTETVSETITKQAVDKVVYKGTKKLLNEFVFADAPAGSTFVDSSGKTVSYSKVLTEECTAYTATGNLTSMGHVAQVGIVAVNPNVIPYGTKMYITSGSYVYGYAIAGDTGGALFSNRVLIDLYMDTEEECLNFGRRDMTVYILD